MMSYFPVVHGRFDNARTFQSRLECMAEAMPGFAIIVNANARQVSIFEAFRDRAREIVIERAAAFLARFLFLPRYPSHAIPEIGARLSPLSNRSDCNID